MPCGLTESDKKAIGDTKQVFAREMSGRQSYSQPNVFTTELVEKVNARWEQLLTNLANEEHTEGWRVYSVGHETMMALYYSVTADLGQSMGSTDSYGLTVPLERIWVPTVLTVCGATEADRARFQNEYAASVT